MGTVLEAAADMLARFGGDGLDVSDDSGRRVGRVGARQLLGAMVTPQGAQASRMPGTSWMSVPPLDDAVPPSALAAEGATVRAQAS